MLRSTTRLHPGPPHCPGGIVGVDTKDVGAAVVGAVVGAAVVGAVLVRSGRSLYQ